MKLGQILAKAALIAAVVAIIAYGAWLTLPAGVMGR